MIGKIARKPSARIVKREGLKKHIYQIYIKSQKRYGSPKITQILRHKGHTVTERTVSRLMKELGIRSITKKKYKATTHSKHHLPVYPMSDTPFYLLASIVDSIWNATLKNIQYLLGHKPDLKSAAKTALTVN